MTSNECGEGISKGLSMGKDETRDVLCFGKVVERPPAWKDDVDQHEDSLYGSIDKDIAWLMVWTFVG